MSSKIILIDETYNHYMKQGLGDQKWKKKKKKKKKKFFVYKSLYAKNQKGLVKEIC